MTLRLRLLLTIGSCFALFWALSSVWMLIDLRGEFRDALDERLAASARMVAALVADSAQLAGRPDTPISEPYLVPTDGVACEIRLLRGAVIGRTQNSPRQLGMVTPGFRTRIIDGVGWRSYTVERNGVRITTADRVERRERLFHDIALTTFVPFLVAMIATMFALWFAVRRCLRPLERIRSTLASCAPHALQPLPEQDLPPELSPLASTVNTLLARLGRAIERERRFTGDAAHELRTPLTGVKTHIQVARLAGGGLARHTALSQAEEGVRRLQGTIDQLLTLARVEGSVSFDEDEAIDAGTAARAAIAQLGSHHGERVHVADEGGAAHTLGVPASLAITALRNILDNAVRYGAQDTPVTLRIQPGLRRVTFTAVDHGPGMSDADIRNAGQRFWRKGGGNGSGLGLSIVNAIVTRYGGEWRLEAREGGGLAAVITLPTAEY
ncbi:ATP-binding protein [Massilia horti]|uniref:histidine kinase n=1 Tax=Massilia horti TaxID=2562153 RepID=A0A4Y9T276_9BURK|nr:ATP-binding protein [Massilia horti]TFW31017.1 HAMP domain-containing protein [Massilia horti]